MQIIGIDIGTTTISGAVLEYENEKTVKLLEAKTIENGGFMPTANAVSYTHLTLPTIA